MVGWAAGRSEVLRGTRRERGETDDMAIRRAKMLFIREIFFSRDFPAAMKAVSRELARVLPGNAVVMGGDPYLNDLLPALSSRAHPFVFRDAVQTELHGGFSRDESERRWRDWMSAISLETSLKPRVRILERYRVQYLLFRGEPRWIGAAASKMPGRFEEKARSGVFRLYAVAPD
jgi:hypothetical protein